MPRALIHEHPFQLPYGGTHVVVLVLQRLDHSPVTNLVEIVESNPAVVRQRLVGLPGRLEVFASRELSVWEGDHELGSSGAVIHGLSAGTHSLALKHRGFRTIHQEVEIPPNGYASVRIDEMPPPVTHPVVRTHPETGRRSLFVSPRFTIAVDGIDDTEGQALLDELFAHQLRPEFHYRHRWRSGDLVMWDNRCLLHMATGGYPGHARLLHRTTIGAA